MSTPCLTRSSLLPVLLLGALITTAAVRGQSAPTTVEPPPPDAAPTPAAKPRSDVTVLTPFEVKTNGDTSYGALNTNSLTSFNAQLNKLPITDDIMTREFIDDVGATNVDALIAQYSVGGGNSAVSTDGGSTTMAGDRDIANSGNGGPTTRGLTGGGIRVNGFQKGGGGQLFDIERAEVIQGPQGLLYGAGGAGGVINTILNRAKFDNSSGQVKYQLDEFGTKIGTLDYNVGNDIVALRFDLEDATQAFQREFLGGPIYGAYGQLAFRVGNSTIVRFSYESTDDRNIRNNSISLNAPASNGLPADPRNAIPLRVLVAEGEAGNLDNGHVNFGTMDSFIGDDSVERILTQDYQLSIDTQEFPWLSTQVAAMWDQWYADDWGAYQSSGLTPPGYSTNTTGQWAEALSPSYSIQLNRREAVRFSGVADFKLFDDKLHNQTLFGTDYWSNRNRYEQYQFYQADSNWNVITNPALVSATNPLGRTLSPAGFWIPVPNGPKMYPENIQPFQTRYTNPTTGINYVMADADYINTVPPTPSNPDGYIGPSGSWEQEAHSGGVYVADFLDWFDGRLTTLGGLRYEDEQESRRGPAQNPPQYLLQDRPVSLNLGLNFQLLPWLRPYVSYSSSSNVPNVLNPDPVGTEPKNPSGKAWETGLKFTTDNGLISGALSVFQGYNHNDQYQIQSAVFNAINPPGGNGTLQPSSVWATVDRKSEGATLEFTAQPVPNWRSRLALSDIVSTTESTRNYAQLYNDQFYTNGQGGVIWSDGTPYMVPVTPSQPNGPTQQLTLSMLNGTDPNKNYVAVLDPDSGYITNRSTVFPVLTSPVHGTVFTGVTGLPISAIQLNWSDPNGHNGVIPVVYAGERSPNYAQYQITWTNSYSFTTGWLKGLSIGATYLGRFKMTAYYYDSITYNAAGKVQSTARLPFDLPTTNTLSPMISYRYKWGRFMDIVQLNVNNALNSYHWVNFPNPVSGAYNYSAIYSQTPISFVFSNTVRF